MSSKVGTSANFVDAADGSGLSLLDRVTARSMVQLLGYAHKADWGPVFHAALPVEGESGTLKRHGRGTPSRGNLHAKTGTTNTVAALGGYVTAKNGEVLAFYGLLRSAEFAELNKLPERTGARAERAVCLLRDHVTLSSKLESDIREWYETRERL
jgi:D-alanyl-D-alanine carboxypeptidase